MFKLLHNCAHFNASKVILKILQARLQQHLNREFSDVQSEFQRDRGTRDQIASIHWIVKKARGGGFQKNICFLDYTKPFDYWITANCGKFLNRWEYKTTLLASCKTCMQVKKQQLELDIWNNKLIPNWGRSTIDCILLPCLFNLYIEYIIWNARLDESQVGVKISRRNTINLRYAGDTTLIAESEEELKSFLMNMKEESEKAGLKLNIQETKIMASGPITSW